MTFPTAFNTLVQVIATFLIFIAGYLALILCIIICFAVTELISERDSVVRAYGARPASSDPRVFSGINREARRSRFSQRPDMPKRISWGVQRLPHG